MPPLPEPPVDHAHEAQRILGGRNGPVLAEGAADTADQAIALAQVHATLALVDVCKDIRSELRKARR